MANNPAIDLFFQEVCGDCGSREVLLPEPLPEMGDDFDWLVRDYDGFRLFMLEELAARFAERRRWTPADMEVVIVEALSVILDQLSDMLDRSHAEAFLETARRPDSVRRLLSMIGYDAVLMANDVVHMPNEIEPATETEEEKRTRLSDFNKAFKLFFKDYEAITLSLTALQQENVNEFIESSDKASINSLNAAQIFIDEAPEFVKRAQNNALESYWRLYPRAMKAAKIAGPRAIHTQKRMVVVDDYAARLKDHPLVLNAHAYSVWSGSWQTIYTATILSNNILLDNVLNAVTVGGDERLLILQQDIELFYKQRDINIPSWTNSPTPRTIIRPYLDAYRMTGQEVFLQDAEFVGINISLSIRIDNNYFQSEIRRAVLNVLGNDLGGFFQAGKLQFGEDLHASDIIETVMALDGVKAICLNRFKRVGKRYNDQSDYGRISLQGLEIAVCDNNSQQTGRGMIRLNVHGGQRG